MTALTKVVLANFSDRDPCRRKTRRPPSAAALAQAERIRCDRSGLGNSGLGNGGPFHGPDEQAGGDEQAGNR